MSIRGFTVDGDIQRYDYNYLDNVPAPIAVDSELSNSSENPVQNKVIKSALDEKGTYSKPSTGIPKTDLANNVQESLEKANTAIQEDELADAYAVGEASGEIASFSDGADDVPVKKFIVDIKPVQSGSGDPSPNNVRPISGWTGANMIRTGRNVAGMTNGMIKSADGTITSTSSYASSENYIKIKGGLQVTISGIPTSIIEDGSHGFAFYDEKMNFIKFTVVQKGISSMTSAVENGASYMRFRVFFGNQAARDAGKDSIMAAYGTDTIPLEPYVGEVFPVSWQSEAGTVYGGTLDVTTGLLTVTYGSIASYAGEMLPGEWISDRDVYAAGTTPSTGAQVVYELATPQTYQLTPVEVKTLLGANSVWADTGEAEVQYRADPTLNISKIATEIDTKTGEARGIALSAYPIGKSDGNVASFSDGADDIPVKDLVINIKPVQSGSGDSSPSNVRPISGWTGADIWDDPRYGGLINWNQYLKELNSSNFEASNSRGTADFTDGVAKYVITEVSSYAYGNRLSTKYYFTGYTHKYYAAFTHRESKTGLKVMLTYVASSVGAFADSSLSWQRSEGIGTISQSDTGSGKWLAFRLQDGNGTGAATRAVGDWMEVKDAVFIDLTQMFGAGNEPSTVEEFKALFPNDSYAYNTGTETVVGAVNGEDYRHIEVDWQSKAGTVYGGMLDVTAGLLTVNRAMVDLGDLTWQIYGSGSHSRFGSTGIVTDAKPPLSDSEKANIFCSIYKTDTSSNVYNHVDDSTIAVGANGNIYAYDTRYTTAADFKTAMTGVQLCYELAAPIVYDLAPTEVKTLLAQNNIWADTGEVAVEYRADSTLYVPKIAADVGAVAQNQGTGNAGKFLVVGNDGIVAPVTMSAWQGGSY